MSRRPPLPREHGAWAMFLVSLWVGWLVAGEWNIQGAVLALTATGAFLARHPMGLALKARRRRKPLDLSLLIWAGVYLGSAGLGGLWLVTLGVRPGLLALVPLTLVPVTIKTHMGVVRWQDRRSPSLVRLGLAEVAQSLLFGVMTVLIIG